ncbi:MAG: hypothetical protein V3V05_03035, partial [Pontiella sp.]
PYDFADDESIRSGRLDACPLEVIPRTHHCLTLSRRSLKSRILSIEHLEYINLEWLSHYNFTRPHQGKEIGNEVLNVDFTPTTDGEIKREKKLGGIISHYYREAA